MHAVIPELKNKYIIQFKQSFVFPLSAENGRVDNDHHRPTDSFMQSVVRTGNITSGLLYAAHTYFHCIMVVDRNTWDMRPLSTPCTRTVLEKQGGNELTQYQFLYPRGRLAINFRDQFLYPSYNCLECTCSQTA